MRDSDSFFSGSADDAVETLAAAAATAPEVTAGVSGVASKAGMVTAASWVAPNASTLVATEAASELLEPFGPTTVGFMDSLLTNRFTNTFSG